MDSVTPIRGDVAASFLSMTIVSSVLATEPSVWSVYVNSKCTVNLRYTYQVRGLEVPRLLGRSQSHLLVQPRVKSFRGELPDLSKRNQHWKTSGSQLSDSLPTVTAPAVSATVRLLSRVYKFFNYSQ